ncbi:unnamed protein product [Mytilus coruscus]|uniref:Uncharacterized protein n=1 Tax=Mytilus coruscus TaxID=42192 RepID=A0A6J8AJK5_MYTCO|nr:unnamed protein product [Mytilus coruscus]
MTIVASREILTHIVFYRILPPAQGERRKKHVLIHITPSVREIMENKWQFIVDIGNSTSQFTIEFWANHSPDKNRPKGQIQYDMFPSNYDPSDLCVKIVYEVLNTRFGWVPVDCENQTAKAYTCCNKGVIYQGNNDILKQLLIVCNLKAKWH